MTQFISVKCLFLLLFVGTLSACETVPVDFISVTSERYTELRKQGKDGSFPQLTDLSAIEVETRDMILWSEIAKTLSKEDRLIKALLLEEVSFDESESLLKFSKDMQALTAKGEAPY